MNELDYTGQILDGRYRIQKLLGRGGMGSVYLAEHISIEKKVAVKFLRAEFVEKPDILKRFHREAKTAVSIRHRNIIDVSDMGISEANEPYIVMEYLEGESLAAMIKRTGPISLSAACAVMEPVLSALLAAHEKGVIHRDLKPENIFLAYEEAQTPLVKIIDFGISKLTSSEHSNVTMTGMMIGTPAYMSPEQIRGKREVDHRCDIWAMGVVLYEMLTGRLPFTGDNSVSLLAAVMTDDPTPPKISYEDFPAEAEPLLMKVLSKNPENRPQSAAEFLDELKALSEYSERVEQLNRYSYDLISRGVAGGSLGSSISEKSDAEAVAEILAQIAPQATPSNWTESDVTMVDSSWKGRGRAVGISLTVAVFIGVVVVIFAVQSHQDQDTETATPSTIPVATAPAAALTPVPGDISDGTADSKQTETVRIEIQRAPKKSRIFYGDREYKSHTLSIPKSGKATLLKVSAPGYDDFEATVVPNRNLIIVANLTRSSTPKHKPTKSPAAPYKDTKPTPFKFELPRPKLLVVPASEAPASAPSVPSGRKDGTSKR